MLSRSYVGIRRPLLRPRRLTLPDMPLRAMLDGAGTHVGFHRVYRRLLEANRRLVADPSDRRLIQKNLKQAFLFPNRSGAAQTLVVMVWWPASLSSKPHGACLVVMVTG